MEMGLAKDAHPSFPDYFLQLPMAKPKWVKRMAYYNFPKAHYKGNISSLYGYIAERPCLPVENTVWASTISSLPDPSQGPEQAQFGSVSNRYLRNCQLSAVTSTRKSESVTQYLPFTVLTM